MEGISRRQLLIDAVIFSAILGVILFTSPFFAGHPALIERLRFGFHLLIALLFVAMAPLLAYVYATGRITTGRGTLVAVVTGVLFLSSGLVELWTVFTGPLDSIELSTAVDLIGFLGVLCFGYLWHIEPGIR